MRGYSVTVEEPSIAYAEDIAARQASPRAKRSEPRTAHEAGVRHRWVAHDSYAAAGADSRAPGATCSVL